MKQEGRLTSAFVCAKLGSPTSYFITPEIDFLAGCKKEGWAISIYEATTS